MHRRFAVDSRRMRLQSALDHTSIIRLLEKFTGVREPNIRDWRRQTFGDLASVFRFSDLKARPPALPDTSGQVTLMKEEITALPKPTLPGPAQTLPVQEKGERHRAGS